MAVKWNNFSNNGIPDIPVMPKLSKKMKVVAMGSCFAVEIKKELSRRGYKVLPTEIDGDFSIDFAWYTPDSIHQEVRMACTNSASQLRIKEDYWHGPCKPGLLKHKYVYQDPYRRHAYEPTLEKLMERTKIQDDMMRRSFRAAGVFIFTLGLIESWRMESDRVPCLPPGSPNKLVRLIPNKFSGKATPHLMTIDEVRRSLDHIVASIRMGIKSTAPILFTISPVPLGRTYRDLDVSIANCESKSILRAAVGEITAAGHWENVYYFPSYEMATFRGPKAYQKDTRHIAPSMVKDIINLFMEKTNAS